MILVKPSRRASSTLRSWATTGLITPVRESSPMNIVFPKEKFLLEARIAAASAKSIPGSLTLSHRPILAKTS